VVDGDEFSGKTVEDAIAQAERQLGAPRDTLAIKVLTQGSRGVFGIGAEAARIAARRAQPLETPQVAQPVESPLAPPDEVPLPAIERIGANDAQTTHETDELFAETSTKSDVNLPIQARQVLADLLNSMGFDVEVVVRSDENLVILAVNGENLGVLIGRRGDNLASLQFMLNLILSKGRREWPRVVIDVENYRARREESLHSLADRIAYRVGRGGRPFTLEAMPASDRRIIHMSLRDRADVETYSIGEGASRRVVIAPLQQEVASSAAPDAYRP